MPSARPRSAERLVDLALRDGQRRQETQDVGAGGEDEQAELAGGVDHVARAPVEHRGEQQPAAAHLA